MVTKLHVTLENGVTMEGDSKADIICAIAKLAGDNDVRTYMNGVRYRSRIWNRAQLTYYDEDSFFDELVRLGIIRDVKAMTFKSRTRRRGIRGRGGGGL